ncbi:Josephin-domain-containing protein [Calocera viscosa TUFC12733]|uniref:ubiquitinyl hydrolase 1 n=1 Tax=Calocera viscosa (strain TUFC12733) TaxID=1330018 RepID=A0A167LBB6_CALVF|nr:Josephin-domain-containing protein [Calocera viscosa TUFC12733]
MDALLPHIYHEKQEPGTMTCGQYALNSLLQGHYFGEEDLANIGRGLDAVEHHIDVDSSGRASANVDETGFFSVQVLEQALQVWNLSLVNWRSAAMRPLNARPEDQSAFVLNHAQHWFTLRRFGPPPGYWYNLNSFHDPQWLSHTYLGMFLNQAETEGYTIFAVRPVDPTMPNQVPICYADEVATELLNLYGPTSHAPTAEQIQSLSTGVPIPSEDDPELAAAIAASLQDVGKSAGAVPIEDTAQGEPDTDMSSYQVPNMDTLFGITAARHAPAPPEPQAGPSTAPDMDTDVSDAQLAESVTRSTAALQRFRMSSADELPGMAPAVSRKRNAGSDAGAPKRRRTAGENEEEEMIRRALAASRGEEDAYLEEDDEDVGDGSDAFDLGPFDDSKAAIRPSDRVLDDEDLELQAALRASLEDPSAGALVVPEHVVPVRRDLSGSATPAAAVATATAAAVAPPRDVVVEDSTEDEGEEQEEAESEPAELTLEEIRRRRLARFGA